MCHAAYPAGRQLDMVVPPQRGLTSNNGLFNQTRKMVYAGDKNSSSWMFPLQKRACQWMSFGQTLVVTVAASNIEILHVTYHSTLLHSQKSKSADYHMRGQGGKN